MKPLAISLALLGALAMPFGAQAAPLLTGPEAKHYSRVAVKAHPKMGYRNAYKRNINCRAVSRTRKRCSMMWDVAVAVIRGHTNVWLTHKGQGWDYSFRFTAVDRRCIAYGGSRSQCTHHYQKK